MSADLKDGEYSPLTDHSHPVHVWDIPLDQRRWVVRDQVQGCLGCETQDPGYYSFLCVQLELLDQVTDRLAKIDEEIFAAKIELYLINR